MRRRLDMPWCLLIIRTRSSTLMHMRPTQATLYMQVTTRYNLVLLVCTLNTAVRPLHRVLCRRLSTISSTHKPTPTARQGPFQNRVFSSQPSTEFHHLHRV